MDIDNVLGLDPGIDMDADQETVPPGDEGFNISHEGGEFEVFDNLAEGVAAING
jgi:hypothetical protein